MKKRKKTYQINVGAVKIGGNAPVSVQSMTTTDTRDAKATLAQIRRLERAGCEIIRVAVPDEASAAALPAIVKGAAAPVIADIHFNYRLALQSIAAGVHCIRINPGNIGGRHRLAAVVQKAKAHGVAIRIGINSGSLERDILKKHRHPTAEALVESALRNIKLVEDMNFNLLKVSLKSSDVRTTVDAYRLLSKKTRYPLHVGITEAGTAFSGTIKSSIGLGILLDEGIGDTLRVSLSADPVEEVRVGYEILKCLGLRKKGPELISCPTCARRQIDVISMAKTIEKKLAGFTLPVRIAVMGCEVNGPGEAKEADVGIAGSRKIGVIFKKGVIVKRCSKENLLHEFFNELYALRDKGSIVP
ncbi:MAG: flavodoxin-dependent (E)-4-hydroxy-3-methylbut-2-enyl-diphosphate synthase [Pseudomonadota bacterium]